MESPDHPSVSVVIPCFNQAHFLREAIQSVADQHYPTAEIIIVDDGSTDDTVLVAHGCSHFARCIRKQNAGLAAARNTGLNVSSGKYIVFLDADDRLVPDSLRKSVEFLEQHPDFAFAFGRHRLISEEGSPLKECHPYRVTSNHYAALLHFNFIEMHATVMYRRGAFDAVGPFNPDLKACEDYDLYLRIAQKFPIACHDALIAEYRQHSSNMTRDSVRMLNSALQVLEGQWSYVFTRPKLHYALHNGIQFWRDFYGERILDGMLTSVGKQDPAHTALWTLKKNCWRAWKSQQRAWECRFAHPSLCDELIQFLDSTEEQLFSEGVQGVQEASWINDERVNYEFRLYQGRIREHCLASVIVTREGVVARTNGHDQPPSLGKPFIDATPNPVPDSGLPGVTHIRWHTATEEAGQVYLRLSLRPESFWLSPALRCPNDL